MTIRLLKDAVRAEALACRAAVDPAVREMFAAASTGSGLDAVRGFDGFAVVVSAFLPIRDEPDLLPLVSALAGAGTATALPVTPPRDTPLLFRLWRPGDALVAGRFGTSEPAAAAPAVDPDVLFVPLAAFDARGFRLGYGAGYYDGALRRLRAGKPIRAIGVAFAAQQVARVPTEPHDEPLNAILTEAGLTTFGPP